MYRVMIADDEYYFREAMKISFPWHKYGCEICGEAANGCEALEIIRKLQPEIVLADINMPVLNGLDFIRQAREISEETLFIIISGYEEFEYAREALQLGVFSYILKPVDDTLEKVMEQAVKTIDEKRAGKEELNRLREAAGTYLEGKDKAVLQAEVESGTADSLRTAVNKCINKYVISNDSCDGKRIAEELTRIACEIGRARKRTSIFDETAEKTFCKICRKMEDKSRLINFLEDIFLKVRIEVMEKDFSENMKKVLMYIQDNLKDPDLSVERIAEAVHLNYHYLCVQFKKETGMTVNNYIVGYRLHRALLQLNKNKTVDQAAIEVGMLDIKYFSKCFKKQYGVTPRQLQKGN